MWGEAVEKRSPTGSSATLVYSNVTRARQIFGMTMEAWATAAHSCGEGTGKAVCWQHQWQVTIKRTCLLPICVSLLPRAVLSPSCSHRTHQPHSPSTYTAQERCRLPALSSHSNFSQLIWVRESAARTCLTGIRNQPRNYFLLQRCKLLLNFNHS